MTFIDALIVSFICASLILFVAASVIGILKITAIYTDNKCVPIVTLLIWFTFLFALLVYVAENYK